MPVNEESPGWHNSRRQHDGSGRWLGSRPCGIVAVMAAGDAGKGWDFFISYTQADKAWAEWIAWVLEEDGHRVLIQAWDLCPGATGSSVCMLGTEQATRTIAVLSAGYLSSVLRQRRMAGRLGQRPGRGWPQAAGGASGRLRPAGAAGRGGRGWTCSGSASTTARAGCGTWWPPRCPGRAKPATGPPFLVRPGPSPTQPAFPRARCRADMERACA